MRPTNLRQLLLQQPNQKFKKPSAHKQKNCPSFLGLQTKFYLVWLPL